MHRDTKRGHSSVIRIVENGSFLTRINDTGAEGVSRSFMETRCSSWFHRQDSSLWSRIQTFFSAPVSTPPSSLQLSLTGKSLLHSSSGSGLRGLQGSHWTWCDSFASSFRQSSCNRRPESNNGEIRNDVIISIGPLDNRNRGTSDLGYLLWTRAPPHGSIIIGELEEINLPSC